MIALPDAWAVSPTEDLLTRLERLFGDRVATLGLRVESEDEPQRRRGRRGTFSTKNSFVLRADGGARHVQREGGLQKTVAAAIELDRMRGEGYRMSNSTGVVAVLAAALGGVLAACATGGSPNSGDGTIDASSGKDGSMLTIDASLARDARIGQSRCVRPARCVRPGRVRAAAPGWLDLGRVLYGEQSVHDVGRVLRDARRAAGLLRAGHRPRRHLLPNHLDYFCGFASVSATGRPPSSTISLAKKLQSNLVSAERRWSFIGSEKCVST